MKNKDWGDHRAALAAGVAPAPGAAPAVGLTWDHPRGYVALEAAAGRARQALGRDLVHWNRQPLEGFESHPIGELAETHDLLVLDHPHIGEAVATDCLTPLEDLFPARLIAEWQSRTVGRAMASYQWQGQHWALPLDVATQVMASRADLLRAPAPGTWDEVVRVSQTAPVALALAGPHAFLHLLAICAALGAPPDEAEPPPMAVGKEAWRILSALHGRIPHGTERLNPIGLLDAMARTDEIHLVPLVYGYVNYAAPAGAAHAVSFDDAPSAQAGGRHGSILGGTGIAVTKRCKPSGDLLQHLAWLMSEEAQRSFIPAHAGQPSARVAWQDDAVNLASGDFYRRTAATVADAAVRPRWNGYVAFQDEASGLVRAALADRTDASTVLAGIAAAWRRRAPRPNAEPMTRRSAGP